MRSLSCVPIRILLDHLEELEGLKNLASHILGPDAIVCRTDAVSFASTIDLRHGADTSTSTEVQVADGGRCGNTHSVTQLHMILKSPPARQQSTSFGAFLLEQDAAAAPSISAQPPFWGPFGVFDVSLVWGA